MRKLHIFGVVVLGCIIIDIAWAEQITLTTYYPAPYGVYNEMRAKRMAIGDNYIDGGTYDWDATPPTIDSKADLHVAGPDGSSRLLIDGNSYGQLVLGDTSGGAAQKYFHITSQGISLGVGGINDTLNGWTSNSTIPMRVWKWVDQPCDSEQSRESCSVSS